MHTEERVAKDRAWLEGKYWYRLIKVAYVVFCLFICTTVLIIAWGNRPRSSSSVDKLNTWIYCKSGNAYRYDELNIIGQVTTPEDIRKVNILCRGGQAATVPGSILLDPEYEIDYKYTRYGSLGEVFQVLFFGIGGIFVVSVLLRGALFYVVCGSWNLGKPVNRNSDQGARKS